MKVIHVTDSTIKGYHIFKVTPFPTIQMLVEKGEGNSYDPHAMVIKVPDLKNIPIELHDRVIKEAKCKTSKQTVRDTAGRTVGRVPANVCALFHKLLQDGDVREITCVSVDKPMQSKTPFFVNPLSGIQKDMIGVVGVLLFRTRITLHALMKVHKEC